MASALDLSASLPGEADMLAAVAASPADEATKLVYADWLEEHGDARAAFLRDFVESMRTGGRLLQPAGMPTGWLEIIGVPLVETSAERVWPNHSPASWHGRGRRWPSPPSPARRTS